MTNEFENIISQKIKGERVNGFIRLISYILDTVVLWFTMFIPALLSFIVSGFLSQYSSGMVMEILIWAIVFGLFFGHFFLYYTLMEKKYQKTVGKFIFKIKVVTINGDKPSSKDIYYRTLFRLIPFDAISFIFKKNGFHDYLSNTIVVKE